MEKRKTMDNARLSFPLKFLDQLSLVGKAKCSGDSIISELLRNHIPEECDDEFYIAIEIVRIKP